MAEHVFGKVKTKEVTADKFTGDLVAQGIYWDVRNYASLAAAVTAAGSTPRTIVFSSDQTVSANLTIPANVELMRLNGAKINHGAYTISYAGSTARWTIEQMFNGTGAVTLSGTVGAWPEWFATNTTPGTTDMTDGFKKAAVSVKALLGTVMLRSDIYKITSNVFFDGVGLMGVNGYYSRIHVGGAITALTFAGSRKKIGHFSILFNDYSTSAAPVTAVGVQFGSNALGNANDQFSNNVVEQVYVRYAGRSFAACSTGTTGTLWNNTFINCRSDYQSEYGWYFAAVGGSTTQTWINCMIDGVNVDGALGYSAQSAGWYLDKVDDPAWINCQADDMYDGKAIYINEASHAEITNFRSESSQFISNDSALIYVNAVVNVNGVKLQVANINPGSGNSASIIRFGSNGVGTVGNIETQTLFLTSGTFYKVNTSNVAFGRGRVTITGPRIWMADVKRDDAGERTVFANKAPRFSPNANIPATGTFEIGDQILTTAISAGRIPGRTCTTAGTMGTLASTTATTTLNSSLVTFNSTANIREGVYISIAGVTGTKRVVHIGTSTQAYIDSPADVAVSSAAVSFAAATFIDHESLGYRTGTASPVNVVTPYAVREEYLDTAAGRWYKAKGLLAADWVALN